MRIAGLLLAFSVAQTLPAQRTATLHTEQTTLRFEAGESVPRLLSVRTPGSVDWENRTDAGLIQTAMVDGHSVQLHWKFNANASSTTAKQVSFVYDSTSPHLRLTWEWHAPAATGPIEHGIHLVNLEAREIWIPLQASLRFSFSVEPKTSLDHLYIEKGANRPSNVGTHQVPVPEGYRWEGTSSTYATEDSPAREIIPWFMLERSDMEDGWYVGVEFSGRTSLTLTRDQTAVSGTVGLNPSPGPFLTRLPSNGSFDAPPIFLGAFKGGRDSLGNILRPWIKQVLTNPRTWKNPEYPMLVNNSWGSGMQVDEALARRMIQDSAELGLEMYHIDAGWFRGVGDWYPDPKKFPHGLGALSDDAHRHGLKFGIWVDWAQAGIDKQPGALNVDDPKVKPWLVADVPKGWVPDEFVGRTIDLGVPAAKAYAMREVQRIVSSYKLDMLEHDGYVVAHACARSDHPHSAPPDSYVSTVKGSGIALPLASNSTDVSYHAVRAYYDIYSRLRKQNPDLLLEICNDGGRMVDFGSASHGDYFSITDTYDPLSNRRAFYDASQVLPSAMLEDYVEKWSTPRIENFRYMLRSGMMGWLTIMQDTNNWTPDQHAAAKEEFALYKSNLRPLIRNADLYHISERPDGVRWDGMEYFDQRQHRGVVYAFRGSTPSENEHAFRLGGIRPDAQYSLHFQDGTSPDKIVSGHVLMDQGLRVSLLQPDSSELVFFREMENSRGAK